MKEQKILKSATDYLDIEELACIITGLDYDEINADTEKIEQEIWEQLDVDLERFQEIVSRLLPLIDVGHSPLTEENFKGFADVKNKRWIVKTQIKN